MNRLIISTVRRYAPAQEASGYIYILDLETLGILRKSRILEPPFQELDDNPRGGMRGGKGIAISEEQIILSNYSILLCYSPQWDLVNTISHPSCAGIHDIAVDGNSIWVSSSRNDLLLQLNSDSKINNFYDLRNFAKLLPTANWKPPHLLSEIDVKNGRIDFRHPRTHVKETYDNAHVNSIVKLNNNDLLVSLGFVFNSNFANLLKVKNWLIRIKVWPIILGGNDLLLKLLRIEKATTEKTLIVRPAQAYSAIIRIQPDGTGCHVLTFPNMTVPSHSLLALPDESCIYLRTTDGNIVHFDPINGKIYSENKVTNGFLRGVTLLVNGHLVLGSQGELIVYDYKKQEVLKHIQLSDDVEEAIYDIKILPSHFILPPKSLNAHFQNSTKTTIEDNFRNHL